MRDQFADEFDKDHWWKSKSEEQIDPRAAVYEIARRHPRIGELRKKFRDKIWYGLELKDQLSEPYPEDILSEQSSDLGSEPRAVHCLCLIGLKSWPELTSTDRGYWIASAGKLKGVECRDPIELVNTIHMMALVNVMYQRITEGNSLDEIKSNPFNLKEIENEIASLAVIAHREGNHLLWAAPGMTSDQARDLLAKKYSQAEKAANKPKQRAKWNQWLPAIEDLEDDMNEYGGVKSPILTRYKRIMEDVQFS